MKRTLVILLLFVCTAASAAVLAPTFPSSRVTIGRYHFSGNLAIHTNIASCDALDQRALADVAIKIPTGVTSVTFWGCETADGTYRAIYGNDAAAATITVTADRWYTFPSAVFPHAFVKVVSAGGTGTAVIVAKT